MPSQGEYQAYRSTMTDLLGRNSFSLPTFQRPYVWGQKEINELIDDLSIFLDSSQPDYFLGLISLEASGQDQQNIIDGQQRLISFTLLCSSLYRLAKIRNYRLTNQDLSTQRSLIALGTSCMDADSEPRINFVEDDAREIYKRLMNVEGSLIEEPSTDEALALPEDEEEDDPQLGRTGETLKQAFELIQDGVATMFPVGNAGESKYWQAINKLVGHVLIVVLPLPAGQEALMVFQRMNNRGRQLSDDEKVKTVFAVEAQRNLASRDEILERIKDRWINSTNDLSRLKSRKLRPFALVLKALARIEINLVTEALRNRSPEEQLPSTRLDLSLQWQKIFEKNITSHASDELIDFHLSNIQSATWLTVNLARGRLTSGDPGRRRTVPPNQMVLHASRYLNTTQHMPLALMTGTRLQWTENGQRALLWALDRRMLLNVLARERPQYLEAEFVEWVDKLAKVQGRDFTQEITIVRDCMAFTSIDKVISAVDQLPSWQWSTKTHRKRIRALLASLYFDRYTPSWKRDRPLEHLMSKPEFELDHILPQALEDEGNKNWIHSLGNLTILERVENHEQRDALPESSIKQDTLRRSRVQHENKEIAETAKAEGGWGLTQSDARMKYLENRVTDFFTRDLPGELIVAPPRDT